MAIAGRGDFPEEWLMIPKGMLENEKWEPLGIMNHDFRDMILVKIFRYVVTMRITWPMSLTSGSALDTQLMSIYSHCIYCRIVEGWV